MPSCSVVVCKNRSDTSNFKSNGITYHRFPKDPKTKEKWMNATNRGADWWPLKRSTICSAHFKDTCFKVLKNSRRLFEWAIPTLRLKLVYENTAHTESPSNIDKESNTGNISNEVQSAGEDEIISTPRKRKLLTQDTPRHRKMRLLIKAQKSMIIEKNKKIRALQQRTSRYKKKIVLLEGVLKEICNKDLLYSDQVTHLENPSLSSHPFHAVMRWVSQHKTGSGCIKNGQA